MIILLMGVCGVGKTTVGLLLGEAMGARYIEGDAFHSTENREKMESGTALSDDDRQPWLHTLGNQLASASSTEESVILGCSALKASYRAVLKKQCPELKTVFLHTNEELLRNRLQKRLGHFMSPDMLNQQLQILEPPQDAIKIDVSIPPKAIVSALLKHCR